MNEGHGQGAMKLIVSNLDMGHVAGSVQLLADCGCRVWVAPTGMAAVLNAFVKTETICWRHAVSDPDVRRMMAEQGVPRAVPGARAELAVELGKDYTDLIYDRLGIVEAWPE